MGEYQRKSASITAQNTFTEWMPVDAGAALALSISGTWVATVTLQRRINAANTRDYDTFTANTELDSDPVATRGEWRAGVKTGDFGSGTVVIDLASEEARA